MKQSKKWVLGFYGFCVYFLILEFKTLSLFLTVLASEAGTMNDSHKPYFALLASYYHC